MKALLKLCVTAMPVVLLAACATTGQEELASEPVVPQSQSSVQSMPSAEAMPAPAQQGFQGNPLDDPDSLLSKRVIYFDFDQADIKPEYRQIVQAHAEYLIANGNARIVLEGHTDERGSREYNMGLGERRANAVRSLFTLQGVSGSQVSTVSFGEERPIAMGQNEDSWRLNRRVEILYR